MTGGRATGVRCGFSWSRGNAGVAPCPAQDTSAGTLKGVSPSGTTGATHVVYGSVLTSSTNPSKWLWAAQEPHQHPLEVSAKPQA